MALLLSALYKSKRAEISPITRFYGPVIGFEINIMTGFLRYGPLGTLTQRSWSPDLAVTAYWRAARLLRRP